MRVSDAWRRSTNGIEESERAGESAKLLILMPDCCKPAVDPSMRAVELSAVDRIDSSGVGFISQRDVAQYQRDAG
eukprot:COSAG06_NODE_22938_length_708_cov_1.011494_2_plen_74_part_01